MQDSRFAFPRARDHDHKALDTTRRRSSGPPGSKRLMESQAEERTDDETNTAATLIADPSAGDELRAQYLACSYLVSACEQALKRMATLNRASAGRSYVPQRALELIEAIGDDWRGALQDVARLMVVAE